MVHRFDIGQVLDLRPAPHLSNRTGGPCHVIARLPQEGGPVLYRVQCWAEGNERVVDEIDLTPSTAERASAPKAAGSIGIAITRRRKP